MCFPESTQGTRKLENRLEIGSGYHKKWYRSQRDHWLGWLVVQEGQALSTGKDPKIIPARTVWQRLNCSPMMFWLADVGNIHPSILAQAESAAIEAKNLNPKDGPPHGKFIRNIIPWDMVEANIIQSSRPEKELSNTLSFDAYTRLAIKNSRYRYLRDFILHTAPDLKI